MDLISKAERDDLELNSWERAIIWSALVLRASNVAYAENPGNEDYPYKNAVRINLARAIVDGALTANLRIEATLPYNSVDALGSGGNFLLGLYQFFEGEPEPYVGANCSQLLSYGYKVTPHGLNAPNEPEYIETLEKYFVWCCWEAELSLLSPLPNKLLPITVDFFEESTPTATIRVIANIPIDYEAYKDCENLVCSCLPLSSQISPAGLRSFSWEEITGRPTFNDVAFSGDYSDLTNTPSIPSSLEELNRFNELVRTINGEAPDPTTGNVDLTLDVGSVNWTNVNDKPNFTMVAFSGSYNDLSDTPSIPVLTWLNISSKPSFADIAFSGDYNDLTNIPTTFSGNWANITGKPSFATVAISGSYNDLTDKPNISGGEGGEGFFILGTKDVDLLESITSPINIPFSNNGYNGIIDWIGKSEGTTTFSNPHNYGKIVVSNSPSSNSRLSALTDQANLSIGFIYGQQMNLIIDFTDYSFNPSQISISCYNYGHNTPSIHEVRLSNNLVDWDVWGEFTIDTSNSAGIWKNIVNTTNNYYKYINIKYKSGHNSLLYTELNEIEVYGNVTRIMKKIEPSDFYYILYRNNNSINFQLPSLNLVNNGDYLYLLNQDNSKASIISSNNENIMSSNGLNELKANSVLKIIKGDSSNWFLL